MFYGKPPPAPEKQAVEISRNKVGSLTRIGKVTVNERGSPLEAKTPFNATRMNVRRIITRS